MRIMLTRFLIAFMLSAAAVAQLHDHSDNLNGGNISTTAFASANKTGNGTKVATGTGSYVSGHCVSIDANGNLIDFGSTCAGSSSVTINTTSPLGGGGTGSTFTLTCTGCLTSVTAHNLLSSTHGDTTAATVSRGAAIFGIGSSPTWTLVAAPSATGGYFKKNSSGDIVASTGAAGGTGSCSSHNFETGDNADASPTCGQPAVGDLQNVAADSVLQNASGSSAAPAAVAVPNCANDNAHALIYSTSSHTWICQAVSGGAVALQPIVTKTSGYTITTTDFSNLDSFIFTCSGTCDVLLPATAPSTNGQFVSIKNNGTVSIFVMPNGLSINANTLAPEVIAAGQQIRVWTDGSNYFTGSGVETVAVPLQSSRRFAGIFAVNASTVAVGTSVTNTATGTFTNVAPTLSNGQYEAITTSTSNAAITDVLENGGMWGITDPAANIRFSGNFALDDQSSGVTNIRGWFGLVDSGCSTTTIGASDTPNCNLVAFRCSANVPDSNWQAAVGKSGASVTVVSTGVACSRKVFHTFSFQEHGGNTIYFFVDGSFKACIGSDSGCTSSSNYPVIGSGFKMWAEIENLNAAARAMDFTWMQVESDR